MADVVAGSARRVTGDGFLLVGDAALTPEWVAATLPDLLTDPARLAAMGAAASGVVPLDADELLADLVVEAWHTRKQARR